jgi:hypothetical protein
MCSCILSHTADPLASLHVSPGWPSAIKCFAPVTRDSYTTRVPPVSRGAPSIVCYVTASRRRSLFSHRLLKMIPEPKWLFSLNFLSSEISKMILLEAHDQVVAKFKEFALENTDSLSSKFRGNIYEY